MPRSPVRPGRITNGVGRQPAPLFRSESFFVCLARAVSPGPRGPGPKACAQRTAEAEQLPLPRPNRGMAVRAPVLRAHDPGLNRCAARTQLREQTGPPPWAAGRPEGCEGLSPAPLFS
jgi:hypothetical protein